MNNREKALALSSMNRYDFSVKESNAAYNAALAMAQWKDEQLEAEKQALINKACEWMSSHLQMQYDGFSSFIKDFRKAMKGG